MTGVQTCALPIYPRAEIFKGFVEKLAVEKGREDDFALYSMIENYSAPLKDSKLIVIYMVSYGVIYFVALMVSHMLGFRLETNIRKTGLKNLINASFAFFDTNPSGKVRKTGDCGSRLPAPAGFLIVDNLWITWHCFSPLFRCIFASIKNCRERPRCKERAAPAGWSSLVLG